jgi:hypothetical protein
VIDVANPLDFSKGMLPTLAICNTDLAQAHGRAHDAGLQLQDRTISKEELHCTKTNPWP